MTEIRDAVPADESVWRSLWADYLAFYQADLALEVSTLTFRRLMDPGSAVKMRLALHEGLVAGFAIHIHHPSTWVPGDDCYLEDLYIAPAARGQGLGRALIEDPAAPFDIPGRKQVDPFGNRVTGCKGAVAGAEFKAAHRLCLRPAWARQAALQNRPRRLLSPALMSCELTILRAASSFAGETARRFGMMPRSRPPSPRKACIAARAAA